MRSLLWRCIASTGSVVGAACFWLAVPRLILVAPRARADVNQLPSRQ